MAIGAHYQEIDLVLADIGIEYGADRTPIGLYFINRRVHVVPRQMLGQSGRGSSWLDRLFINDSEDAHLPTLLNERQRVSKRSCSRPACIPGDRDVVERCPDFALGMVRQDQQRATEFEDEVLGNVVGRRIGFPQRQNREVMQARLLDQVLRNFNGLAPHEAVIVRNAFPYRYDLEGAEQISRVRCTFLRISGENSADVKRIGIEADRRLNVHLIRKGGYARLQGKRELNRVLYRLSFRQAQGSS